MATTDTSSVAKPTITLCAAHAKDLPAVPGRRDWVEYLDHGVTTATSGRMRAQRGYLKGPAELTGWHYHVCDMQFVYLLNGSITLQLEDGNTLVLQRGDSVLIPGGYKHAETDISDDFDFLEISIPADMGTIPCPVPESRRNTNPT